MAVFEEGKRYKFSKKKLIEDMGEEHGRKNRLWLDEIDGCDVTEIDGLCGEARGYIVVAEWCEEI